MPGSRESPYSSSTDGEGQGTDRADAEALGEAVVRSNVLVQQLDRPLPQAGAVVALVQVEEGCGQQRAMPA